jgi:hypothetical protein
MCIVLPTERSSLTRAEYIPDTSDGFTDPEFEFDDMDLDEDDIWERSEGEEMEMGVDSSEPSSEGDDQDGGMYCSARYPLTFN